MLHRNGFDVVALVNSAGIKAPTKNKHLKEYHMSIGFKLAVAVSVSLLSFGAKAAVTELQGCTMNDGKTMDDVLTLAEKLNRIQDGKDYAEQRFGQMIMSPIYDQSGEPPFDFLYLNYWGNYQIYGNDLLEWEDNGKGKEFMAELQTVVNCRSLNLFNTIVTREYPGD